MKSTSIVRKVDKLGRVVLPIELRRALGIDHKDSIEMFVEGKQLIFKKYIPQGACVVTGEVTPRNKEYVGGLVLSPLGAKILFNEIQKNYQFNT
jgi:AbrB family transcriptional regulator, transcriptional pleiotropic regulator of transition state genes